jgi:catalase
LAERAVDAAEALTGRNPGKRALHAKGTLHTGTFTATPAASALTHAPHMQGQSHRVTGRFSNGSGAPDSKDYGRDGRGLAVKIYLDDGRKTDIVSVTRPTFFVRTPEDFVELMEARRPDPETGQPDMERMGKFFEAHPESLPAIQAALEAKPPASYATTEYFGIHAFRWVNADGDARWVRYQWEPEAGVSELEPEAAKDLGRDYLRDELADRLVDAPVGFRLFAQLAEEGDPTDDPTEAWPDERERVEVGRLEVTGPETEREQDGDVLVFDPTRVIDGIELSEDRILRFRPEAYAVSVERRSGVRLEA